MTSELHVTSTGAPRRVVEASLASAARSGSGFLGLLIVLAALAAVPGDRLAAGDADVDAGAPRAPAAIEPGAVDIDELGLARTAEVEYALSKAVSRRGGTGRVLFSVRTKVPLKSLAIAIDFDETRMRVTNVRQLPIQDAGPVLADALTRVVQNNFDKDAGSQLREGWVAAMLDSGDTTRDLGLPLGDWAPVLAIEFQVRNDADFGFSPLKFRAIQVEPSVPASIYINQVEAAGDVAAQPLAVDDRNFMDGGIEIIGEVGFFMRGDANFDLERDISDPVKTLHYLFMQGPALPCADAGDANDDGQLDVSDPIFMLTRLYVTSEPFPDPDEWGVDPTPDDLGCDIYSGRG